MTQQTWDRNDRQRALRDLLKQEPLRDQETVVRRLAEVYGIQTTQAVISRDLQAIGAAKKASKGGGCYVLPEEDLQVEILKRAVVDVRHNETMVCIVTGAGLAAFVGDWLDHSDLDILGCLAGENVVFVAPKTTADVAMLAERIKKVLWGTEE